MGGAKIAAAREEPAGTGKDTGPLRDQVLRDNHPESRGKGLLREQLYILFSPLLPNKGENLCGHRSFAFQRAKAKLS